MFNKLSRWFLCIVMFENYCLKLSPSSSGEVFVVRYTSCLPAIMIIFITTAMNT